MGLKFWASGLLGFGVLYFNIFGSGFHFAVLYFNTFLVLGFHYSYLCLKVYTFFQGLLQSRAWLRFT